jgi:hypothetical protein
LNVFEAANNLFLPRGFLEQFLGVLQQNQIPWPQPRTQRR